MNVDEEQQEPEFKGLVFELRDLKAGNRELREELSLAYGEIRDKKRQLELAANEHAAALELIRRKEDQTDRLIGIIERLSGER